MNKNALNLFAAVALIHVIYRFVPLDDQRQWFYVLRGVGGAYLFWLLMLPRQTVTGLVLVACWWGLIEEAQTSVCGVGRYGLLSAPTSGLCLDRFGPIPYIIGGTAATAYLLWRSRSPKLDAYLARFGGRLRAGSGVIFELLRKARHARKGRC